VLVARRGPRGTRTHNPRIKSSISEVNAVQQGCLQYGSPLVTESTGYNRSRAGPRGTRDSAAHTLHTHPQPRSRPGAVAACRLGVRGPALLARGRPARAPRAKLPRIRRPRPMLRTTLPRCDSTPTPPLRRHLSVRGLARVAGVLPPATVSQIASVCAAPCHGHLSVRTPRPRAR